MRQDIHISSQEGSVRQDNTSPLSQFPSIWDECLRKNTTVKLHINLQPHSRPVIQHPYEVGLKKSEHESQETDRMLRDSVSGPAISEWASPALCFSKNEGKLRLCVDYRKLSEIGLRDIYQLLQTAEYTDSLKDAAMISPVPSVAVS